MVAVAGVILLVNLLQPRELFLGSNSVAARDYVAPVKAGERLCVRDILVPAGTQRIRWGIDTQNEPRIPIDMQVRLHGGPVITGHVVRSQTPGFHLVDIPMTAPVPGGQPFRFADLCLLPRGPGGQIFVWGRTQLDIKSKPIEVGKQRLPNRVALWFLPLEHEQRSILAQQRDVCPRVALPARASSGPGCSGSCCSCSCPALLYGGIRLLATADEARSRRVPVAACVAMLGVRRGGELGARQPGLPVARRERALRLRAVLRRDRTSDRPQPGQAPGVVRSRGADHRRLARAFGDRAQPGQAAVAEVRRDRGAHSSGGLQPRRRLGDQRRRLPPGDVGAHAAVLRRAGAGLPAHEAQLDGVAAARRCG